MRVALAKMPATYADWYKRPVYGLSTLCSVLESCGHEVRIFDGIFWRLALRDLLQQIADYRPSLVGLTAMTHEIQTAARLAEEIKRTINVPVVVGGPHITALPRDTLEEFPVFDYGVFGEGEETCRELLEALERGENARISQIEGLVYRQSGEIRQNHPRTPLSADELDKLPFPAYHQYYGDDRNALSGKDDQYVMFSSRGCPYRCAFCMVMLGNKVRRHSPGRILDEMELAHERFGAHTFNFADDIFLTNSARTRRTLELMIERRFPERFRWSGLTRVNYVKPDLIELAKEAGCYSLEMGVESGDDGILAGVDKNITVESVREAVATIKRSRLRLGTYYILGHPNETEETARKTVSLACSLNTDWIAVGMMVPYPGTRVYEMASKGEGGYRLRSKNWADYDKYGGCALETQGVPWKKLELLQKRAILGLYVKNFRFREAIVYLLVRRHAIIYFLRRAVVRVISGIGGFPQDR